MKSLDYVLPLFTLTDAVSGKAVSSYELGAYKALLVMFICNHCPYVKHILPELRRIQGDYAGKGLSIVAINSNDVEAYPEDGPIPMKHLAEKEGWLFPYVLDESQTVAQAFEAACTPDFFLFNQDKRLVYRGQLDDSRPKNTIPLSGRDLRHAIDYTLQGVNVPGEQSPSIGCNIKWKSHG